MNNLMLTFNLIPFTKILSGGKVFIQPAQIQMIDTSDKGTRIWLCGDGDDNYVTVAESLEVVARKLIQ